MTEETKDILKWILPMFGIFLFIVSIIFFVDRFVYTVYYHTICKVCYYSSHDNGLNGKFHREWEESEGCEEVPCIIPLHHGISFEPHTDSIVEKDGV